MHHASGPSPNPSHLSPGTLVGSWRVVAWAGSGVHGSVYRAVRVGQEPAEPVALKLALLSRDPRFAREVELLSRLSDPSLPRLRDSGNWQHPSGTLHPYLVMDWVEGVPLYDFTRLPPPTARQVLQWLAQLARALQCIHAQGAVHRDVKGDNVLVRRTDGRAMLMDLGSGRYPEAATLTPPSVFPGTPAYRPPEAWLFSFRLISEPTARYCAGPADDLFALGVTACRLLTGAYPELSEPRKDGAGNWHLKAGVLPPPRLLEPDVEPRLRELVLRMLSVRPEERGTAKELAEALDQAAEDLAPRSAQVNVVMEPVRRQAAAERWRPRLVLAAAGLMLVLWAWWWAPGKPVEPRALAEEEEFTEAGQEDAGTVGLGEALSTTTRMEAPEFSFPEALAEDTLPEPLPGQTRPDAKGRCPRKRQVALNGGCWLDVAEEQKGCEELRGQMFKGRCYVPFIPPGRQPTSGPKNPP